jgi:hypothetical protein
MAGIWQIDVGDSEGRVLLEENALPDEGSMSVGGDGGGMVRYAVLKITVSLDTESHAVPFLVDCVRTDFPGDGEVIICRIKYIGFRRNNSDRTLDK